MVPGSRNCLHVIDEIQEMRSPSSVSGLRLSLTIRLPLGNFLQELNSFSPTTVAPETLVPVVPAVTEVMAGVVVVPTFGATTAGRPWGFWRVRRGVAGVVGGRAAPVSTRTAF